MDLASL